MKNLEQEIIQFLYHINKDTLKIIKRGNMLPKLIRNFLIDKIISEIFLEQNIYDKEIKKFYLKNNILNKKDLDKICKIKGITEEELNYQITLPLKVSKFAEQNFQNEIESYFLERKDFLDEYTFNIIRHMNKDLSYELYFRIESEESDFTKLSETYSYYSELYPKGLFGPRNLQGMNSLIVNKLLIASPGELIQPFQVDKWWIILKLIKKKEAKLDKSTCNKLLIEIFNKFINNQVKNFTYDYLKTEINQYKLSE